jgi:Ser/Thr protein kinase RdoA (MazF antagonist)
LNALCHGDCWTNNFMVRTDPETQQPLDLRFIDLQMMRYAPIYCDLQYFLYLNTKRSFRTAHLDAMMRTYVDAFNAHANVTPDLLTLEKFTEGFEETRLCGALLAISMLPLGYIGDIAPADGQELTEENFLNLMGGGFEVSEEKQRKAVQTFNDNEAFKKVMEECIMDLTEQMDKLFCVSNAKI